MPSACNTNARRVLIGLLALLLLALLTLLGALVVSPLAANLQPSTPDFTRHACYDPPVFVAPPRRRSANETPMCCPPVVTAVRELLDGYYTTNNEYEWVPFSSALRSVPDSEVVEPFDILLLSDSLDRLMMEWICKTLPDWQFKPPHNNKFPGFGEGRTICESAWGNITWLLITGAKPVGPYHFVGDESEFYTPRRIEGALAWYREQHAGRAPPIIVYQSNLWDVARFEPRDIGAETGGAHANFMSVMRGFSYSDPSVATEWVLKYTRDTEANIVQLRTLAPPPETLIITRTSPLTNHRFQSAVNSAVRRVAAKQCIPLVDWDELARVHMLNDTTWAQVQQGWYADKVHPHVRPTLTYGYLLLRFVRYFYKHMRQGSDGGLADWSSCDAPPFRSWTEELEQLGRS